MRERGIEPLGVFLVNAQPLQAETTADRHPLAGQNMSGADVIVQVLADEGVDVLFGYSGGAILPVYDAVFRYNAEHARADGPGAGSGTGEVMRESMPLIVPANEQGAGFMAAGYARASGKVGVAIVTSGPGATNMVTPVRDSMADSIPLVVICGQVRTAAIGSDAFQEAPISNIMGACAKHVFLVTDAAQLEATVRTAFTIARSGRPGPVVVDVPKDVQNTALSFRGAGELALSGYRARLRAVEQATLSDADCAALFTALMQAERPLIYAGGGVISAEASAALRAFVDAFGLPVTTTLMGLGGFDTTDPLALHMLGMHGTAYANYAVEDCDFVLTLGARFDDRVAGVPDKFAPRAKFIAQIDIDPAEVGKVKPVDWHHVGPLRQALERLAAWGRAHGIKPQLAKWHAHVAELKRVHAMNYDRESGADPAVRSAGSDQPTHPGPRHRQHRRRPAPDVGGAVLRLPRTAALAHLRLDGHDGFRLARGDRRAVRAPAQTRHRHRRRRQHPHEHRRAGNGHHLWPAAEGRGAQQRRRRHGAAMAEAVLQGPLRRLRQEPAQEGLRTRPRRPTASTGRGAWNAWTSWRRRSPISSPSTARRFSK